MKETMQNIIKATQLSNYIIEIENIQGILSRNINNHSNIQEQDIYESNLKLNEIYNAIKNIPHLVHKETEKLTNFIVKESNAYLTFDKISSLEMKQAVDLLLKIHEIFKHKEWKKLLSMCISKILSNIEDIEPEYGVRLVKSVLQNLNDFEIIELQCDLDKESINEVKSILVDFMFRFKDKKYAYIVVRILKN